jgi:hypothetical protein
MEADQADHRETDARVTEQCFPHNVESIYPRYAFASGQLCQLVAHQLIHAGVLASDHPTGHIHRQRFERASGVIMLRGFTCLNAG